MFRERASEREREREREGGCLSGVRTYMPALCCSGAGCLRGVTTYLPALCCSGAGCISGVGTYLPGTVLHVRRLLLSRGLKN